MISYEVHTHANTTSAHNKCTFTHTCTSRKFGTMHCSVHTMTATVQCVTMHFARKSSLGAWFAIFGYASANWGINNLFVIDMCEYWRRLGLMWVKLYKLMKFCWKYMCFHLNLYVWLSIRSCFFFFKELCFCKIESKRIFSTMLMVHLRVLVDI